MAGKGSSATLGIVLLAVSLAVPSFATADELSGLPGEGSLSLAQSASPLVHTQTHARLLGEPASDDVRHVADWATDTGDNRGLPFVIVDKVNAEVFVFDKGGQLRGAAPALLGEAKGDDSVPGIGDRELSRILPEERTTPAGRFVAALGNDLGEQDVLWVDYEAAISLHRVITSSPKERRLQRLATPSVLDNRISYGCINVPVKFYESVVRPAFISTNGIVYILPETRSIRDVIPGYDGSEPRVKSVDMNHP